MYTNNFLFRMTDTVTSQNIDIPSWDTLCIGLLDSAMREDNFPKHW